ncbi:YodC family protein [Enterobacter roggenkampii]|uniref:YodC family protein n=1 Tax=Enterobacter roggenkampii TaxID=1812935 RepID=UPI003B23251D
MSDEFKTGDIVKLKSGGPDMTIKAFLTSQGNSFLCQWFAGKKLGKVRISGEILLG